MAGHGDHQPALWSQNAAGLVENRLHVRDMFKDRVTDDAAETAARKRQGVAQGLDVQPVGARATGLLQRPPPGVNANCKRLVKSHARKMAVATTQVKHRAGDVDGPVEAGLDGAQQGAEGRQ